MATNLSTDFDQFSKVCLENMTFCFEAFHFQYTQNQDEYNGASEQISHLSANMDAFFLIINGTIIYLMQCGFAFLECGAVRAKNATNILIKNILDSFIGAITYWFIGFPLAFGNGGPFCGEEFWLTTNMPDTLYAKWFFHFVFAATAATIVSGSVAERCDFPAYIVYSTVITGFLYPLVTHWAWHENGWLFKGITIDYNGEPVNITYQDFGGSGAVHLLGGTAALVAAYIMGPRIGKFDELTGHPNDIRGHSVPLAALGGFILFFGFFAFNGGSQGSISQEGDSIAVMLSVLNTIISGSFGAIASLVVTFTEQHFKQMERKWSLLSTINGGLSGMVAICAGCNQYHPWSAAVIGLIAGFNFVMASSLVLKMKIDDPLDAGAVHAFNGLWGVLAVPIFSRNTGLIFGLNKPAFIALGWNLLGASVIMIWSALLSVVMFMSLKRIKYLRVSNTIEVKGLDVPKHGEPAYPLDSYGDGWSSNDSEKMSPVLKIQDTIIEEEEGEDEEEVRGEEESTQVEGSTLQGRGLKNVEVITSNECNGRGPATKRTVSISPEGNIVFTQANGVTGHINEGYTPEDESLSTTKL